MGVLNRNIAGSARLVSYGTGTPGYIGWAYVAWRAGTKSANLAQSCLKLRFSIAYRYYFREMPDREAVNYESQ